MCMWDDLLLSVESRNSTEANNEINWISDGSSSRSTHYFCFTATVNFLHKKISFLKQFITFKTIESYSFHGDQEYSRSQETIHQLLNETSLIRELQNETHYSRDGSDHVHRQPRTPFFFEQRPRTLLPTSDHSKATCTTSFGTRYFATKNSGVALSPQARSGSISFIELHCVLFTVFICFFHHDILAVTRDTRRISKVFEW